MSPILKDLQEIIAQYGRDNNYLLIFDNAQKGLRSRTGLLYASDALDIGDEILKLLDAKQPGQ